MRISVWLKTVRWWVQRAQESPFQSAVRISVWLKHDRHHPLNAQVGQVSIRRADLCLVEGGTADGAGGSHDVSIRRADLCLVEAGRVYPSGIADAVSIRRADLCLVEDDTKF